MAVVSPMRVIPQEINPVRYPDTEIPGMMASRSEIIEEQPPLQVVEDKMYVAVGKELKESKSTLSWALHNSGGRKICILHVHEPAQRIPLMGTKFPVSQLEEHQVRAYREIEKQDMNKLLRDYSSICSRAGVHADVLHIDMDSIEKGIVELISQHGIRKLVMGAAADKHYSKKMMEPKSKKAIYVRLKAPIFCHIWFICRGHLVHTREGKLEGISMEVASLSQQASPIPEVGQYSSLRTRSVAERKTDQLNLPSSGSDYRRVMSDSHGIKFSTFSPEGSRGVTPRTSSIAEGSVSDWDEISRSPYVAERRNDQLNLPSSGSDYHRVMSGIHGMKLSTFSPEGSQGVTPRTSSIAEASSSDWDEISRRSPSVAERRNDQLNPPSSGPDYHRVMSDIHGMKHSTFSPEGSRGVTPRTRSIAEGSSSDWDEISRRSSSLASHYSSCSSIDMANDSAFTSAARAEDELVSTERHHSKEDHHQYSSPPSVLEGGMNDELYDQLDQAMAEADNSRREAFKESLRRRKAEKDAIDAVRRAKASESLHAEELRQRKEIEEALARTKEELEKMKQQVNEITEELRIALEQKSSLESQIANSNQMVQELEQKMFSAVELLQKYKKERDELQVERDNALKVAEELREKQAEAASNTLMPQFFSEFSFSEIEEATANFDPSLKIGEGGYGSIYKGLLRHTQVAIKTLNSNSLQGPSEFQQEVNVLSKLRHPNLVTLVGACPEAWILVYEYLPNGSLEDRLSCKDNSPPLSWQSRIRIASELCSALIFLHSCNPHSIVHGDLKPANILLDGNYVSKLSDFGICRVIDQNEFSSNNTTLCCRTDPKGTFAYMDPEFLATGEITPKSDVYSFGVILLRLLTGRPALGITKEVQYALDKGNLKNLLDPTAGDWPFVQAQQLAHIAMRCCEMSRKGRPDLARDVWRVLEPMRVSCGAPSFRMNSEDHSQIPTYFVCPIFQEIMEDPHVAADGFTYELEALKGWLDGGHDTSPMTNLQLAHCNLVPNRALRSAIQEWLQQR